MVDTSMGYGGGMKRGMEIEEPRKGPEITSLKPGERAITLLSWNSQGWEPWNAVRLQHIIRLHGDAEPGHTPPFNPINTHVACIQEASNFIPAVAGMVHHVPWYVGVDGYDRYGQMLTQEPEHINPRCSMAMVAFGGIASHQVTLSVDESPLHRPLIAMRVNDVHIINIHAPASGGYNTIQYIARAISIANREYGAYWIMIGDFNVNPFILSGYITHRRVCTGGQTHNGGGEIDYALLGGGINTGTLRSMSHNGCSDHYPVKGTFFY